MCHRSVVVLFIIAVFEAAQAWPQVHSLRSASLPVNRHASASLHDLTIKTEVPTHTSQPVHAKPRTVEGAIHHALAILESWNYSADVAEALFLEANTTGCFFLAEATSALRSVEPLVVMLHRSAMQRTLLPFRSWIEAVPDASAKFVIDMKTAIATAVSELALGCERLRAAQKQSIEKYRAAKERVALLYAKAMDKANSSLHSSKPAQVLLRQQTSAELWPFTSVLGYPLTLAAQAKAAFVSANESLPVLADDLQQLNATIVDAMVKNVVTSTVDVLDSFHSTCLKSTTNMPTVFLTKVTQVCTKPNSILVPMTKNLETYMASIEGAMASSFRLFSKLSTATDDVVQAFSSSEAAGHA